MKRILLVVLVSLVLVTGSLLLLGRRIPAAGTSATYAGSPLDWTQDGDTSYPEHLESYADHHPDHEIVIDATQYASTANRFNDDDVEIQSLEGINGLYVPEMVDVTWVFTVPEAGFYNINITYVAVEGRSADISRGLMVNGAYPFVEAQNFVLSRIWEDEFNVADRRSADTPDVKPRQMEKIRWNSEDFADAQGYYNGQSFDVHFEEGVNELTLVSDREPVLISTIKLYQTPPVPTYQDYVDAHHAQGATAIGATALGEEGYLKIQAENSFEKSTPLLAPVANWSSFKVDPYQNFTLRYNTIGGTTWRVPGDWVSWQVEVPTSGLYQITFKANQNYNRGLVSTRILRINGTVPFEEARAIEFSYDSDWQNVTLGGDEAYWFHLEAGINTIELESTIGIYRTIIRQTESSIQTLNNIYRQVIMITGTNPDEYQDYRLHARIPELSGMIDDAIAGLTLAQEDIIRIAGERSGLIASFEKTLYQLERFQQSEQNIQIGLNELDDNIAALGTWVTQISEQPLALDAIYVHAADADLPKASTNFFQKLWHELVMLFGSYGSDTSLKSTVDVDGPTITVWIMTGRDQSQLLRQIIDEQFSVQSNINVDLKLISQTALLPATLSGNGPDVALGVVQNIPVNWGIRNAVADLSTMPGFDEVATRFHSSAMTPFVFQDAVYAIPETQDFLLTFVRRDIVEELGVTVPVTWDDVVDLAPALQRQHLDYYLPSNNKNFQNMFVPQVTTAMSSLLYSMLIQNGGQLYQGDGAKTMLLEEEAIDSFMDFTTYFSDFGFQIEANFANRFRSGEMPIGVFNFSLYNTLAVFAPEIRGKWEFAPMPGTLVDGQLHNQTTATTTGVVILEDSTEKDAAWEFVKWWTSAEAQAAFGRGLEAILGSAARYPTANLEAFSMLPWSTHDYLMLTAQREQAVGIPTVPGDYIIGRYMDYAFRATVNDRTNPRDNLFEYVTKIDLELARKREEFGLD